MQTKVGPDTEEKLLNEKHFQKKQNPIQRNQIKQQQQKNQKEALVPFNNKGQK